MEDDDEFGDLYTDVLKPFSSTSSSAPQVHLISPAPSPSLRPIDSKQENIKNKGIIEDGGDEEILNEASRTNSSTQVQTSLPDSPPPAKFGGFVLNSTGGDAALDNSAGGPRVLEREDAKLPSNRELLTAEDTDMIFDIEEGIPNQGIPGLSSADRHDELINLGSTEAARDKDDVEGRGGEEEDWDSDSDDDLRILLNDVNQGPMGMDRGGLIGDDDDEDDGGGLNIVADGDPTHQVIAEQEWGEDAAAKVADGEKKEGGEAGKGSAANAVVPKIGYSNHGYQYPFHSQFKYVRPGATPMPGATTVGPGGAPGQVRPPVNMVPAAGRGRGDWRPLGNKSFHPGFGMPGWGNNMGRGFGGGLEFTLPSHKTIFDVDIDTFEEKPWKYPGVDISDFFNFGLNEESWKDYCKQLEQHRLETTMQSRIRVYESGRAEQDYDPDLPPELAAAAGIDVTADNANLGKPDVVHNDSTKLPARVRPPIPTGRAIQVEGGSGERLPSIDTRPPRIRDSDAIIEIILQDSLEDEYSKGNVVDSDPTTGDLRGSAVDEEDDAQMITGYFAYDSRKRKLVRRRTNYMDSVNDKAPDRDGIVSFPSETPLQYPPSSGGQTPVYPSGKPGTPEERRTQGRAREQSSQQTPSESTHDNKFLDNDEEEAVESTDARHGPMLVASSVTAGDELEANAEHKDTAQDETGLAEGSSGVEKDERISSPNNMSRDGTPHHAMKNPKLSSQVEQPGVEVPDDAEDSKAARSSENSKARSGSSRDDQKWQDGAEEEVIQDGHSTRSGSIKRQFDGHQKISHRKDRDTRYEMDDTHRVVIRGREDSYTSRDLDPRLSHRLQMKNEGLDRRKERDNSDGAWQRRDEDPHTRKKPEDARKREHGDEMGSRHRGKVRESERGDKEEHFHSKKQLDNGSYRVRYEKDVISDNRERDDSLKNRYEIVDDYRNKRRRDDEYLRRDLADKDEILHAHRESSSRRKREKDDVFDPRKRNDQQRVRDNIDDYHSLRHKDEIWMERERGEKQRGREEWHRLKQSHEENLPKREREEARAAMRSGRGADDRAWAGHARAKDEYKGSDKEIQLKDTVRHGDLKRRDRSEDESFSHHRGREDIYLRGSQFNHPEKRSRQEKSSARNDRGVSAADNQKVHEKKQKENLRKSKESEAGDHYTLFSSKRNQEDQSGLNEMGLKGMSEQGNGSSKIPTHRSSSRKHREDASSDDEQQDSKRGRSKLERWTSHLERDYSINSKSAASLKFKEMDRNNSDGASDTSKPADELVKTVDAVDNQYPSVEEKSAGNLETKDGDAKPVDDRHLDTVEKLKKRSERFKLPMPSEKDAVVIKKIENEVLASTTSETPVDSEIKPERPARKRRWISN